MTFPTAFSDWNHRVALAGAMAAAARLKAGSAQFRALAAAENVSPNQVEMQCVRLNELRNAVVVARDMPGMADYAKAHIDGGFDLTAEADALIAQIDAALAVVVGSIPKDANGFMLTAKIAPDGSVSRPARRPADNAATIAALEAVEAAIA